MASYSENPTDAVVLTEAQQKAVGRGLAESLALSEEMARASTMDLVALDEAKQFLKIPSAEHDPKIEVLITRASSWLERRCNRPLKARPYVNVRLPFPRSGKLYLEATPIDQNHAIALTVDGTAETVWQQESDGDPADFDWMIGGDGESDPRLGARNHLIRTSHWSSRYGWLSGGPYPICISYTGGFNPVPEELKLATCYLVQKLWRDQEHQRTSMTSVSIPSGGSVTMPETQLALPREVDLLIQPYRRYHVA